ncbi:cytochrome P450 [Phlegmacium glaucopus]|nr:cytochrome P450 [Phlegmacium glaucopus]
MGSLLFLDVAFAILTVILLKKIFTKRSIALPPGPPKLPLLDNFLDLPTSTDKAWITFSDWGKKWGNIVSISALGQHMVILNSAKTAVEMLDKKSAIYSDRPVLQMGGELVGWNKSLGLLSYGERFRNYRKFLHQVMGNVPSASLFYPVEELETHRFLKRVAENPGDLAAHLRKTAGAIILHISYGYEVKERDDPFVTLADEAMSQISLASAPGSFLVDFIPPLRYLPAWFPGAGFKRTAVLWGETLTNMVEAPYQFVKQQMESGTAKPSFTSRLLEEGHITAEQEDEIKWSAQALYGGGADTTVSTIYSLFLAMTVYPDVARKAQAELDAVVGTDRLPKISDRGNLPYTNAVALELMRWHTVLPTCIPHCVMEDDIHDGYLIPKGAFIFPNIWFMLHDPKVYSDPMNFNPERFLGQNMEKDPRDVCFGFGRRICPGRILADSSIFIACAMILSVFDISKYSTKDGIIIEPVIGQTAGTISHPEPFKCSILPRSQKALDIINSDFEL